MQNTPISHIFSHLGPINVRNPVDPHIFSPEARPGCSLLSFRATPLVIPGFSVPCPDSRPSRHDWESPYSPVSDSPVAKTASSAMNRYICPFAEVGYGAFECIQRRFCNRKLGFHEKCREDPAGFITFHPLTAGNVPESYRLPHFWPYLRVTS